MPSDLFRVEDEFSSFFPFMLRKFQFQDRFFLMPFFVPLVSVLLRVSWISYFAKEKVYHSSLKEHWH